MTLEGDGAVWRQRDCGPMTQNLLARTRVISRAAVERVGGLNELAEKLSIPEVCLRRWGASSVDECTSMPCGAILGLFAFIAERDLSEKWLAVAGELSGGLLEDMKKRFDVNDGDFASLFGDDLDELPEGSDIATCADVLAMMAFVADPDSFMESLFRVYRVEPMFLRSGLPRIDAIPAGLRQKAS